MSDVAGLALAAGVAFAATPLLAYAANRSGWLDAGTAGDAERKLQARPVPPVGGAAVLLGVVALLVYEHTATPGRAFGPDGVAFLAAVVLAFALGTWDDLRAGGLGPAVKLAGQALVGGLVGLCWSLGEVFACGSQPAAVPIALGALGGIVVLNAVNIFDNADGALASVGALALGSGHLPLAGPLLGFLPWNLTDPRGGGRSAPRAYLGDAGSHVVGVLAFSLPAAWPVLTLPLLDLARVSLLRLGAGVAPWHGDRRHLAHDLSRAGLGPRGVALALALVALPSAVGAWLDAGSFGLPTALGALGTTAAFALAVRFGRAK